MSPVLITGMGMLSPLGRDSQSSFDAALAARSAICRVPDSLSAGLPDLLMAPAAAEPAPLLDREYAGLDRAAQLGLVAAQQAMADAGIAEQPQDAERFGVYVGIGFSGAHTLDAMFARYYSALYGSEQSRKRAAVVHPLSVPRMMANAVHAAVSMHYGLRGMGNTYSVACASSAVAAGEALRAIRHGYLDAALVIGAESMLTQGSFVAWNALRVMARVHADDPAASCRPFDRDRSGFVLGEGAAALVLESATRARGRGVPAHAELAGYGASSDAHHLTAPSMQGQVSAMRQALADAGLEPSQIRYLNAHGTATDTGDVTESQAILDVFATAADSLAVSSTKAVHGHLIGAGGAMELALSVLALNSGWAPPTAHLQHPDPRCPLDYLPLKAREIGRAEAVMSNSFAFGGSNASLIARRVRN
ncbi:MAG: beta-ketoacyl-[acyl-carrier-protein] synthase family protein [Thiomonas sp.]